VRNLPDGRVEVVAEGESTEIDRFMAAIQNEMDAYIMDTATECEFVADRPLKDFSIRF
jgi:acylphosphatase